MANMNQTSATANQSIEICRSRMTRDLFFPDVMSGNVQEMEIPTVDELIYIGRSNIFEAQDRLLGAKCKLHDLREPIEYERSGLADKTIEDLQKEHASEDGHIHCDWCGIAHEDIPDDEFDKMSHEEYEEAYQKRLDQVFSCRFGPNVAAWCGEELSGYNTAPRALCCNGDCRGVYQNGEIKTVRGSLVDDGVNSSIIPWQENISINNFYTCHNYKKCHGDMPLKDQTCILEYEEIGRCVEHLDKIISGYTQRIEFIEKYLMNIETALKSDALENRPSFVLRGSYHLLRAEKDTVFALIDWEDDEYILRYGVLTLKRKKQIPYEFVLSMLDKMKDVMRFKSEDSQNEFKGLCIPQKDFIYLMNHPEYWQVWLQLIDTKGTEVTTERLFNTLARLTLRRG